MNRQSDCQSQDDPDQQARCRNQAELFPSEAADGRQSRDLRSIHAGQLAAEPVPDAVLQAKFMG